jgi:hypothetical protein
MDKVATMPVDRRFELFRETAAKKRLSVGLVEKDFWVCWSLHRLSAQAPNLPATLLFKGGTSLSKVFDAIDRFSEDVDLSLNREDLGFTEDRDPYAATSNKQARRLIEELSEKCTDEVRTSVLPILTEDFVSILGAPGETWSLRLSQDDPQTILFAYPQTAREPSSTFAYVQPQVRLEIGARSDHWPSLEGTIEPYAATEFPNVFQTPQAIVRTLAAERTFWEKVTLLHAEHHRPPEKSVGPRLSRHYYDVVRLYQGDIGRRALAQPRLLESVVRHKSLFFRSGWANYQTAVPGSIRISPTEARVGDLKRDYQAMAEMFFSEPPSFDEILRATNALEDRINSA